MIPAAQTSQLSDWESISPQRRRLVLTALVLGFSQFVLVDVYFRLQELASINQYLAGSASTEIVGDAIRYPPMVVSFLVYGILIGGSVLWVNSWTKKSANLELVLLGSAWILASIPLAFDFLVDSFELKLPVAVLFIYAGLRYWKGSRNNPYGFILAPLVTFIAAGDGIGHLTGAFCGPTGLDSCSAKAVSDSYLVMMLLALMYFSIRGRDKPPSRRLILVTIVVFATVLGGIFVIP